MKEAWLRRVLAECRPQERPACGTLLSVEGRERLLVPGAGRAAPLLADRIEVPEGREGPALAALLRHMARTRAEAAVCRHAATLGLKWRRLNLRDTRSRWGSCSSQGT